MEGVYLFKEGVSATEIVSPFPLLLAMAFVDRMSCPILITYLMVGRYL
jgi:hypothetical protein